MKDVPHLRRNIAFEIKLAAFAAWPSTLVASQSFACTLERGRPVGVKNSKPGRENIQHTLVKLV